MWWNKKKKEAVKEEPKRSQAQQEVDMMVIALQERGIAVENFRIHTSRGICFFAYLPEIKPFKAHLTAWDAQLYLKLYPKDVINE